MPSVIRLQIRPESFQRRPPRGSSKDYRKGCNEAPKVVKKIRERKEIYSPLSILLATFTPLRPLTYFEIPR